MICNACMYTQARPHAHKNTVTTLNPQPHGQVTHMHSHNTRTRITATRGIPPLSILKATKALHEVRKLHGAHKRSGLAQQRINARAGALEKRRGPRAFITAFFMYARSLETGKTSTKAATTHFMAYKRSISFYVAFMRRYQTPFSSK